MKMKFMKQMLDKQIREFLSQCGSADEIVIGVLRYGAHLPHLYQNACIEASLVPRRVPLLLSHMLGFFPLSFFQDKKFLVVDDTVYEGTEMKRVISMLMSDYGVPRDRIRTATLAAHEQSKFIPDCPNPASRLADGPYIAWKEELATLVRRDIRPTERDHPLYYLRGKHLDLNQFLSIIEQYGNVHPVGDDWDAPVFRLSMTIDLSGFTDLKSLIGLELNDAAKVRFYWQQLADGFQLTIAPIAFARVTIPTFLTNSSVLAQLSGLEDSFFVEMSSARVQESNRMLFYFVTRILSAIVMLRLFHQLAPSLRQLDPSMHLVSPEEVDGYVDYVFPEEYTKFYGAIYSGLETILAPSGEPKELPLAEKWARPVNMRSAPRKDPLLPQIYEVLDYVARDESPAIWDGMRWTPSRANNLGVPVKEIVHEFRDQIFVSAALDELLDSGLLRARDEAVDAGNSIFERRVLPGGEYNAVHVSRITDTLRCQPAPINPQLAMEEASELWGPY